MTKKFLKHSPVSKQDLRTSNALASLNLHTSCALAALAVAVATITYAQAAEGDYTVTTSRVATKNPQKIEAVTNFANKSQAIMSTDASKRYLTNQRLSDSSTFASRLLNAMKARSIRTSPTLPIPARDMSCYAGVPSYKKPANFDMNKTPVTVEADEVEGDMNKQDNDLTYKGKVVIAQVDRTLDSDVAHYERATDTFTASGKSVIRSGEYTVLTDDDVHYHLKDKTVNLTNTEFQFNGSVMRGTAEKHDIDNIAKTQVYKNSTLTTCPAGDESWHLSASTVEMDRNEAFGHAWNVGIWAGDIPVFYLPYINFPITSERRTGLLYPSFSIGSEHMRFTQPIYFNLAPNYDWTFTPSWLGEHRWQFYNEIRFMPFSNFGGSLIFNYLPNDTDWDQVLHEGESHKRWYMHLKTFASFFNGDLTTSIDYQRVRPNDFDYISDLAQPDAAVTDDHLIQQLRTSYVRPFWQVEGELRRYQSLVPDSANSVRNRPFAMLPKLSGSTGTTDGSFAYGAYAEITRFELENFSTYSAEHTIRSHLEPYVKYHVFDVRGTTLDMGLRGFFTHYDQGKLDKYNASSSAYFGFDNLDRSVNRGLYEFEVRGHTTFERKVLDMRHTQTIEPEIKYQYIPYHDQRNIALYDTTDHLDDYYSLYSFRRYAGIDRIADVNAITTGVTSRLLDAHDREVLRVGLAQTYSFDPTRVTLYASNKASKYPRSVLASNIDALMFDRLYLHSALAYDTENSEFRSYNASLSYKGSNTKITTNYRFVRDGNYDLKNGKVRDLRQVGLALNLALNHNYSLTGAIYRDLEQSFNIDRKLALRRENCCTAFTFFFEDYAKMDWTKREHKRDRVLGLQVELKNFYTMKVQGVENPMSTSTHYMPFVDPTNLNR